MDEKLIFQAAVKIYIEMKGWNAANSGEFSEDELMDRAVSEARALAEKVRGSAGDRATPPPPEFAEKILYILGEAGGKVAHPRTGYTAEERGWLRELEGRGEISLREDCSAIEISLPPVREREAVEYFSRRLGGRKDLFLPLDAVLADFENRPGVALLLNKMAIEGKLGKCASLIDGDNPLYSIGSNFPLYGVGE